MSMNELFGGGGGKPKLITAYTSGTGTYIPLENNSRCFIRRQGAGGAGCSGQSGVYGGSGGGAGAQVDNFERVPITGITYSIGAKGVGGGDVAGTDGSQTRVGNISAPGGRGAIRTSTGAGAGGYLISGDPATGDFGLLSGISGGAGAYGGATAGLNKGHAPGRSRPIAGAGAGQSSGATSAGGGGDSAMGQGGNGVASGTGGNATGYGAGGGGCIGAGVLAGGDGSGGYAEIWDYGA